MKEIYPGDTRDVLEVFCVYEAKGEYFDISVPSQIVRDSFVIGNRRPEEVATMFTKAVLAVSYVTLCVRRSV